MISLKFVITIYPIIEFTLIANLKYLKKKKPIEKKSCDYPQN